MTELSPLLGASLGQIPERPLGIVPLYVMAVYVLLLLGLGVYGFIKSKTTEDDYYLAGRGQPFLVTALTIMATFFSSAALLGIPGAIYKDGIAFFFFALNLPLAGAAIYILGSRIARIGRARGYVSPGDMLSDHYDGSNLLRILVALTGFMYAVPYVVLQIRAGGHLAAQLFPAVEPIVLFGNSFDVFDMGASLLACVMTLYILIGGMRSIALADCVQGILLISGMLISGVAVIYAFGGIGGYFEAIADLPKEALSLPGASGRYSPWLLMTLCIFASTNSMVQPAQWMRYYAARSTRVLKHSALLFALLLPMCYLFGVQLVGIGARALYPPEFVDGQFVAHPQVGDADQALVAVLREYGPELFGVAGPFVVSMILMAVLAASMSTADSNLHALSAVLTRDIYDRFLRPSASERERTWFGRGVIVAAAMLSLWFVHVGAHNAEFAPFKMIVELQFVAMAYAGQVLPVTIDLLFVRRGTKAGAVCGMVAGLVAVTCFTPAISYVTGDVPHAFGPEGLKRLFDIGAIGCAVNAVVFIAVSTFTKRLEPAKVAETARLLRGNRND